MKIRSSILLLAYSVALQVPRASSSGSNRQQLPQLLQLLQRQQEGPCQPSAPMTLTRRPTSFARLCV
jgi:hypothetical protein